MHVYTDIHTHTYYNSRALTRVECSSVVMECSERVRVVDFEVGCGAVGEVRAVVAVQHQISIPTARHDCDAGHTGERMIKNTSIKLSLDLMNGFEASLLPSHLSSIT